MNEKKTLLDPKKEVKVGVVILNVDEVIKNEIKKFDEAVTEDKLVAAVEGYRDLKIMGVDDKEGYDAVHQARIVLKNMRTSVEQRRKDLKSDFLRVGRAIDLKAEELTKIIEPTEKYLASQEKAVDDEVERLKKEAKEKAERERRERIEFRVAMLREIGFTWDRSVFCNLNGDASIAMGEIEEWPEDDFHAFHFKHKARYNEWLLAEEKRKAEEARVKAEQEALRRAESERLAKERAELEMLAKTRRLEEEQLAKQRAEQERILAEEMKKERERALAEQKKLDEEREKFRIEKENLERQRREMEEKAKDVVKTRMTGDFTSFPPKATITEDRIPVVGTVMDDRVKFEPYVSSDKLIIGGADVKEQLTLLQEDLVGAGKISDPKIDKLRDDVVVLISKIIAHINKGLEEWQQSKK